MKLTKEQFQAFEAFANFNDWDLEITENGWNNDNTLDADDSENQHVVSASVHTHIPLDGLSGDSVIADRNTQNVNNGLDISQERNNDVCEADINVRTENINECKFCFLDPCITTNRQSWLSSNPVRAHIRNTGIRKTKYKKFWTMIQRHDGWNDQRYMRKKTRLLARNIDRDDDPWRRRSKRRYARVRYRSR